MSSVYGREHIMVPVRRMQQPLCGLTVLDTVTLLVVNAKQITDNHHESYYIVQANKRTMTRILSVAVSEPLCVEIKTLSIKSTKTMMTSRAGSNCVIVIDCSKIV